MESAHPPLQQQIPTLIPGDRLIYLMPTILIPPIMTHSSTLCQRCVNGVAPGERVTCLMTGRIRI